MPQFNPGTVGATLHFTAKIPADVAAALAELQGPQAGLDLTPDWGPVPEITVRKLRRAGLKVPRHWNDEDVIVPIVHGQAFYIGNINLGGGAVSFSMKGVNLRTGRPETDGPVSDKPSQTYWAPGVSLWWIDGYVPSDGQAVRQFVPLKGKKEMAQDVARHVGISDTDPYIDAIRGRFFAPVEPKATPAYANPYGDMFLGGGLEAASYDAPKSYGGSTRGARAASMPSGAPVGMGAGARMKQAHEHNPHAKASDFKTTSWHEVTFRMVWVSDWNAFARKVDEPVVSEARLDEFRRKQVQYETMVRRQFGIFQNVQTDVDGFPSAW